MKRNWEWKLQAEASGEASGKKFGKANEWEDQMNVDQQISNMRPHWRWAVINLNETHQAGWIFSI